MIGIYSQASPSWKAFQVDTNWTLTTGLVSYWKMEDTTDYWGTLNTTWTNMSFVSGKVNNAGSFNGSTSNMVTATWLWIAVSSYTLNLWIKPTSIPAWNDFWELLWIFNGSAQYIIWLMLYQGKFYTLQWIWWANWILQPSSPTPSTWTWQMLTVKLTWTTITLYLNWSQIATWWSWTFSWTINQIKIWLWKYVGLIDEIWFWTKAISAQELTDLYNGWNWQTMV